MSDTWTGLLAPAETAPEFVATLNRAINKCLQSPEMSEAVAQFNRWAGFIHIPFTMHLRNIAALGCAESARLPAHEQTGGMPNL
jgi:Tripartite tricarboxylate transporter family receptor